MTDSKPEPWLAPLNPPFWAKGAHAQTVLGHLLPSAGPGAKRHALHRVPLDDGDHLAVHEWAPAGGPLAETPGVVFFHGLGGTARGDYMRRGVRRALHCGLRAFAVEHRGAGEGRGLARLPYNSGSSQDAAAVFVRLRQDVGLQDAIGVGFSLSGNVLLKLACEGGAGGLRGVVAVNPPCDLAAASDRMALPKNRLYELRFIAKLNRQIRERVRAGLLEEPEHVPWNASLREFDERVTAPLAGYANAAEYYARCSTHDRLCEIALPTQILTARDDPFVDSAGLERAQRSPSVRLHVEDRGGHMGYLARGPRFGSWRRWLDDALESSLRRLRSSRDLHA